MVEIKKTPNQDNEPIFVLGKYFNNQLLYNPYITNQLDLVIKNVI